MLLRSRTFVLIVAAVAVAGAASSQTVVTNPTTTAIWAGTADFSTFGLGSLTAPSSGVILSGTAISPFTGKPVRHLWYGDRVNGICRIDPDVDALLPGPGSGNFGVYSANLLTCAGGGRLGFTPGQLAFDASSNMLYTVDMGRIAAGILRVQYDPAADSGQGALNPVSVLSLLGINTSTGAFGGCPQIADPKTGALVPLVPDAAAIGPDGNLYVGSIRDGAIIRIISPATFNPITADCQTKVQIPLLSADEAVGSGHTFGLGWVGHTLFGADNIAPWALVNADQCLTSLNGNKLCGAPAVGGTAPMPVEILGSLFPSPQAGAVSDAQYPNFPGSTMYFASLTHVAQVSNILSPSNLSVQTNYGPAGGFSAITGLTADPLNPQTLYVGVDPTLGGITGAGAIYQVSPCAAGLAPAPPGAPGAVTAVPASGQAAISWNEGGCQPATSYVVRTLLANGAASGVPDLTVSAPASGVPGATIGLPNGQSYKFEVEACNSIGCSPFSPPSNIVSLTVPAAPTGVTAAPEFGTGALVSWTPQVAAVGALPITSYTVSAIDSVAPTAAAVSVTVQGQVTAFVPGLLGGHTYTFTVHATNAIGNGPESAPSLPFTVPVSDIGITMSGPASAAAGSVVAFKLTVMNLGPGAPANIVLSDPLPAPLASVTTTLGSCQGAVGGTALSCALGSIPSGGSATVTVAVSLPRTATGLVTNSATVAALDASGAALSDPVPGNNSASATVPLPADIQVVGSAQNGGPAVGSNDTFTWQIKDNLGTTAAAGVVFTSTLPASFRFTSVSSNQGACSGPAAGALGGVITCTLGTINGGATAIVTVNFTPTAAGTFATTGSATFAGVDTNPANNSFTVTIGPK